MRTVWIVCCGDIRRFVNEEDAKDEDEARALAAVQGALCVCSHSTGLHFEGPCAASVLGISCTCKSFCLPEGPRAWLDRARTQVWKEQV